MNLISINELSKKQITDIFDYAERFKKLSHYRHNKKFVLFFERPSTRTRISFEAAIAELGCYPIYVDAETTQGTRGETIEDTTKVFGLYADFIIARLKSHQDILKMAEASDVPVINALTDLEHPCQAISDLYTIKQIKKNLESLNLVFVGDIAANTANSLMVGAAKMGMHITLLAPKDCKPNPHYLKTAREHSDVTIEHDIDKALKSADVIYTDTFVSMGEEHQKAARLEFFAKYQVNKHMLKKAPDDVSVMHCLPAHRGAEITSEVMDGKNSIVWQQAKNKLIIEKAIILYLSNF